MKKHVSIILALILAMSAVCFAEGGFTDADLQSENREAILQEWKDTIHDQLTDEEYALWLGVVEATPEADLFSVCQHTKTKKVTNRQQTDCNEETLQIETRCASCDWLLDVTEKTLTNSKHVGPVTTETEQHDGITYRVKYCTHCGDEISKTKV